MLKGTLVKALSNALFSILQKIGKSLMVPVSVLPAAGLLVAIGRVLQDAGMDNEVVTNTAFLYTGKLFYSGGLAIFEQLPVIFAIGVAIGFTSGAAVSGLASVVGYFTLTNVLKVIGEIRGLSLEINTGVFGGIIMGLIAANVYKKFYQTELPKFLGFFAGKRLVPIITAGSAVVAGIVLGMIWPPVQEAINNFGTSVMASEYGPAFFAAGKRLLIPVGLHHVYYPPFLYEFGEFVTESGKVLHGESVRFFAGDPTAGKIQASEFPVLLFGLPAAAFAMYLRAAKEKRAAIGGIMFSAALTSMLTGITEPIEFSFIFVAPLLYVFHVLAAFASGMMTNAFDIHLGSTFSPSLIDYVVGYFNQQNSMYLWLVVGPIIGLVYFGVFYTLIPYFNYKTPGRESDEIEDDSHLEISEKAKQILVAIGNGANIKELDACITRLRLTVVNDELVNIDKLKSLGAVGVMKTGLNFQIIMGTESEKIKEQILKIKESIQVETIPENIFKAPMIGEIIPLSEVPDATFAKKLVGDGFGIIPSEGVVYAPRAGKIAQLFHTNHAIGIIDDFGLETLIHIGIDTVKMKGEGFKAFVKMGDTVQRGDKLIEFDINLVRQNAKSDITPVVFTNMNKVDSFNITAQGKINKDTTLLNIQMKE